MVQSSEAETINVPSEEYTAELTLHSCFIHGRLIRLGGFDIASQIRRLRSDGPDTMRSPARENDTDWTESRCPRGGCATSDPDVGSQMQILRSCEPETMRVPSGEYETDITGPSCPRSTRTSFPDVVSHTRMVQSCEQEIIRAPSGEKLQKE
jgi:hypothetical protein